VDTEALLILALLAWISVGPVLSIAMGRRGYAPATWGTIGMFLGPLALPLALDAARRRRRNAVTVLTGAPAAGPGPVAVLAGIDGSEEASAALAHAVDLLGDRLGRLTLVYVASVDAATDVALLEQDEALARRWMASARRAAASPPAEECVVTGQPATMLAQIAGNGDYDLLVIGPRGHGMSPRLFGSVARELAASSPVPVLIGGQPPAVSEMRSFVTAEATTADAAAQRRTG
jgi:nucleotide-binding universal stress UspA family protein